MTLYVNMQDKFMSGWGAAKGGRSLFCIRCATETQAHAAYAVAKERKEMRNVRISAQPRTPLKGDHRKIVDFYQLGPVWKYHLPEEIR